MIIAQDKIGRSELIRTQVRSFQQHPLIYKLVMPELAVSSRCTSRRA
jgi:hypothetical protein